MSVFISQGVRPHPKDIWNDQSTSVSRYYHSRIDSFAVENFDSRQLNDYHIMQLVGCNRRKISDNQKLLGRHILQFLLSDHVWCPFAMRWKKLEWPATSDTLLISWKEKQIAHWMRQNTGFIGYNLWKCLKKNSASSFTYSGWMNAKTFCRTVSKQTKLKAFVYMKKENTVRIVQSLKYTGL